MSIVVIGGGLAGLAAGGRLHQAGGDVVVLERTDHIGGHASSVTSDGFTFDEGAHVLFTDDEEVRAALTTTAGPVGKREAVILNFYRGSWVPHPVQCNLHALPPDMAAESLLGFLDAPAPGSIGSYREWCHASLGREISERFTFPYTRKYWTVEPEELTTDWVGERVYRPSREDVVRGAIAPPTGSHHYITSFSYPVVGGYGAFVSGLCDTSLVRTNAEVVEVDWRQRRVRLGNGEVISYHALISTLPIPVLIAMLPGVPDSVREAAGRLACTSVKLVDVALSAPTCVDAHWFYVYDDDMVISRCSQPHLLSGGAVPEGRGAIQAEVYASPFRPLVLTDAELADRALEELRLMGLLDGVEVLWSRVRTIPYANVIFDHHRAAAVDTTRGWLEEVAGIQLAGRYGLWEYLWTDGAVRSGWTAADRAMSSCRSGSAVGADR